MSYTLPAGRYFIGDICYILREEIYNNWTDKLECKDGIFRLKTGQFVVGQTDYGDGMYDGTDGHAYPVDAGNIGVVHELLFDKQKELKIPALGKKPELGTFHQFTGPFEVTLDQGKFTINSSLDHFNLVIDTRAEEEEEETESK